jgi:hypothetical protein
VNNFIVNIRYILEVKNINSLRAQIFDRRIKKI